MEHFSFVRNFQFLIRNKGLTRQVENTPSLSAEVSFSRTGANDRWSLSFLLVLEEKKYTMTVERCFIANWDRRVLYPDRIENGIHVADITVDGVTIGIGSITCWVVNEGRGRKVLISSYVPRGRNETTPREEKRPFAQPYHVRNPSTGLISRVWLCSYLLYCAPTKVCRWFISGVM